MFIFADRFNCIRRGSLFMSFWVHKDLDFNMLVYNMPGGTSSFWGGNS